MSILKNRTVYGWDTKYFTKILVPLLNHEFGKDKKLNKIPEIQIIVSLKNILAHKVAQYAHLCNNGAMRAHLENSTLIVQGRKCLKY